MFRFQLWCYYEREDNWKLEGFFKTPDEAREKLRELRGDVETPCMPDWEVVRVEVL